MCSPRRCSSCLFMPSDCSARPIAKAGVSIFLLYALGVSIFHKLCCPLCMSPRLLLKVPSSAAGASIIYHIRGVYQLPYTVQPTVLQFFPLNAKELGTLNLESVYTYVRVTLCWMAPKLSQWILYFLALLWAANPFRMASQ